MFGTEENVTEVSMPDCECVCGCGGSPVNGQFLPGHDQILRAQIEEMVGNLLNLRDLIELARRYSADEISLQQFGNKTKSIMKED